MTVIARTADGNPRTDALLKWSSEKPSVASVDVAGLVTGLAPGSVTIKVSVRGGASSTVTLQVVRDAVHKMTCKPGFLRKRAPAT